MKKLICIVLGIIAAFAVRTVLFAVLVPDETIYQLGAEPGIIMDTFYVLSYTDNFYPYPNLLNQVLTVIVGVFIGFILYWKISETKVE